MRLPPKLDREVCGKWMERAQSTCGRRLGHKGDCRTAKALEEHRQPKTARRVGQTMSDPVARSAHRRAFRLAQYGLTEDSFVRLLEGQGNACAMCCKPFEDGNTICVDHDHNCCAAEKRSCGECVRGLLCLRCNTGLGYVERLADLARSYLDRTTPRSLVGS
jgi:hypothetical protein